MSDFADLVRKINEIDAGQQTSRKKTKSTSKSSTDTNTAAMADILNKINNNGNPYVPIQENKLGFSDLDKLGKDNASKVDMEARRQGSADMEPGKADELRYKIAKKMGLVETFNQIDEAKKKEAKEAELTMQDRFAQFLKAEKSAGSDIDTIKANVEEGVAEYELADKGFKKILEMINMLEKMVKENGVLEKRLIAAAGMDTARLQPLADMRQALSDAYDACEDAYQDAMGDFVVGEEKEKVKEDARLDKMLDKRKPTKVIEPQMDVNLYASEMMTSGMDKEGVINSIKQFVKKEMGVAKMRQVKDLDDKIMSAMMSKDDYTFEEMINDLTM